MTKKEFNFQCEALEQNNWILLELLPEAKFARYIKNGLVKQIGVRK
jgi:hypothetical protein